MRTFRASPRYLRYRKLVWAMKQIGALGALVFGYMLLGMMRARSGGAVGLLGFIEVFAWVGFITQLPLSYIILRLDFEMRWYILSDRSLRIREGVVTVSEKTMTFANIQKIAIQQNPLQRIFGIADVTVRSAGGGSSAPGNGRKAGAAASMHEAAFEGVDDADGIRNLIRERIRQFRDAGLGDPDEAVPLVDVASRADASDSGEAHQPRSATPVDAALDMLREARRLRASLG